MNIKYIPSRNTSRSEWLLLLRTIAARYHNATKAGDFRAAQHALDRMMAVSRMAWEVA